MGIGRFIFEVIETGLQSSLSNKERVLRERERSATSSAEREMYREAREKAATDRANFNAAKQNREEFKDAVFKK